jgi:hypothetical protein
MIAIQKNKTPLFVKICAYENDIIIKATIF